MFDTPPQLTGTSGRSFTPEKSDHPERSQVAVYTALLS